MGQLMYWPSDSRNILDLLYFVITKEIPNNYVHIKNNLAVRPDHSLVVLTVSFAILYKLKECAN